MNKQEIEKAIEYFRAGNFLGKSMDKHINVAISVLEQQLNGVWIPEIMKEVLREETTDIILSNPDEFKKWLERGIWNCKRLNELSNCKNVWIPVSERLPKEDGNYLVTMKHKEFNQTKVTSMDFNGEFLFNDYFEKAWWEVTAWQPLPEPYKELATDNNVITKSGKDNNVLTIGDKMRECGEKLSKFIATITNTKDTDLSPEEAQELKAERDYWEREAKKWCAKLGEIRLLIGEQN